MTVSQCVAIIQINFLRFLLVLGQLVLSMEEEEEEEGAVVMEVVEEALVVGEGEEELQCLWVEVVEVIVLPSLSICH